MDKIKYYFGIVFCCIAVTSWADTATKIKMEAEAKTEQPQKTYTKEINKNLDPNMKESVIAVEPEEMIGPVSERAEKEKEIPPNFFAVTFYKPTYILPYYYTGHPTNITTEKTPNGERIKRSEIKYQLSFKVPAWKNIFGYPSTLYLAYTQLSYWQAYNSTAFFRETDYEPEVFLANEVNLRLFKFWQINFLNIGAVHQSNGFGGDLERSWNRIYLEAITSTDKWMLSIKPWVILHDNTMMTHNPNIAEYLGYGQVLVAYKNFNQVFTLQAHNLIEGGGRRATGEFTWSFPITPYLKGYVQVFSGYGQSLIEYDHRTNSIGVGIALSNWV